VVIEKDKDEGAIKNQTRVLEERRQRKHKEKSRERFNCRIHRCC